jgi:hypothetical protein
VQVFYRKRRGTRGGEEEAGTLTGSPDAKTDKAHFGRDILEEFVMDKVDIPLGKALMPVPATKNCEGCCFTPYHCDTGIACTDDERADGKNIVFHLIDMPITKE